MLVSSSILLCLVIGISDGDTIKVLCPGQRNITVRLMAVDSPERRQPYGTRARQALSELCHGQHATITQRSTDRYRRIVADVECQGHDAGSWMVRNGWAMVYRKYARAHGHLYALEQAARHEMLGQWQMLRQGREPVEPWQWRQRIRHTATTEIVSRTC